LKIDLEGWEFDAMSTFLLPNSEYSAQKPRVPRVSQMLLELHLWGRDFPDLLNWWTVLESAGLRAVAREPNLVYQNYNRMQGAELAEVCLHLHFLRTINDLRVVYVPQYRNAERICF
jgi:hypothetical protein